MPPDLRAEFVLGTNDAAAIQWLTENSEPCPHGATLDELRDRLDLPVRRKLPKHVRGYLEKAIAKGVVVVLLRGKEILYVTKLARWD